MIVTLNWLKEFVDVPADALDETSIQKLVDTFNSLGLVIDSYYYYGKDIDEIKIAKVIGIDSIKGADKIRKITTDIRLDEPITVVCGAWNFDIGDFVPYAPIGTVLPNKLEIKERTMRGVTSFGMLCSGSEISLASDENGLMLLDAEDGDLGKSLVEVMNIIPDVVFDIETEGNRPDALSIIGIARDLSAKYGLAFRDNLDQNSLIVDLKIDQVELSEMVVDQIGVQIQDAELTPAFGLAEIENVTVSKSSFLIQQRLLISKMRPLNNLVDISNYLMLERGQPTHPYDRDSLSTKQILVRSAVEGEKLETLDSQTRELATSIPGISDQTPDIVITNGAEPIGIAGIMGGTSTEISEKTSNLALEVANFYPLAIVRTSKRMNLKSEASKRFERGVDPFGIEATIIRYIQLVVQNSPTEIKVTGIKVLRPSKVEPKTVELRLSRVKNILGVGLSAALVSEYIEPLGFKIVGKGGSLSENVEDEILKIQIPTFRPDSDREIDVIEEIARIYGYERIPKEFLKTPDVGSNHNLNVIIRKVKSCLTALGFNECWTSTFLPSKLQSTLKIHGEEIMLALPLAKEEAVLRMSLAPGLVQAAVKNSRHKFKPVNLFEVGHIFRFYSDSTPPLESVKVGGLCLLNESNEQAALKAVFEIQRMLAVPDFRLINLYKFDSIDLRGSKVEHNFDTKVNEFTWQPLDLSMLSVDELKTDAKIFNPGKTAFIASHENVFGFVGELNRSFVEYYGQETYGAIYFELDLVTMLALGEKNRRILQSKYPQAEFDLAFVVNSEVTASELKGSIESSMEDLVAQVWLFDVFTGNPLSEDEKSLAFKVRVANPNSTLSESDIADLRSKIISDAQKSVNARLR